MRSSPTGRRSRRRCVRRSRRSRGAGCERRRGRRLGRLRRHRDAGGAGGERARRVLEALLPRIGLLVVNDEEARLLSGERNVARAARRILALGPRQVLIKRGEYGAILFSSDSVFAVPAFPLEEVFDPTGAGDVFAGGMIGYLAATGDRSDAGLRRAIVYGSVLASYVVEDFGGRRLRALSRDDVERRYRQFVALTEF